MKLDNKDLKVGDIVYICDYRYNDISNKPIRKVAPTKAIVVDNSELKSGERVCYSNTHFREIDKSGEIKKKIIKPFDNTGYRSFTGIQLGIFDNIKECYEYYLEQCELIQGELIKYKEDVNVKIKSVEDEMRNITKLVVDKYGKC